MQTGLDVVVVTPAEEGDDVMHGDEHELHELGIDQDRSPHGWELHTCWKDGIAIAAQFRGATTFPSITLLHVMDRVRSPSAGQER